MKKTVLIFLIIIFIFALIPGAFAESTSPYTKNKFVLKGYVISNIPIGDLFSKFYNVLPGLDKVNNAEELKANEYTDNANDIPLFAKVNLFSYDIIGKKEKTVSDIQEQYTLLPIEDYYEKENIISALNSLYEQNGIVTPYVTKSPPEIKVTYKEVSTGRKSSRIAVRHVVKTNNVITHFLMNPYARPINERINRFDFAETYDINPCFTATLIQRSTSGNSKADFTGFFVDIPEIPNQQYYSIVENSLKQFSSYVHRKNKLLLVENLSDENYNLGKYGDIIGIVYPKKDVSNFLEKVRKAYPDKIIFASIDADFSNSAVLKKILQNLAMYGIYPEFMRDTVTGDFFYYEKTLGENSDLINRYVKIIETENGFKFERHFSYKGFSVSEFKNKNGTIYAVMGNGNFTYPVTGFENSSVYDFYGRKIPTFERASELYTNVKIDDFKFLFARINNASDIVLLGVIPHTSAGVVSLVFRNLSSKKITAPISIKFKNKVLFSDNLTFLPLSVRLLSVKTKASVKSSSINVSLLGNTFKFWIFKKQFPFSGFIIFTLLFVLIALSLFVRKKRPIKKILNVKKFILAVFLFPVVLILLNRYFIHYSLHTITFFVFSLMYLLLAFYDTEFQDQSFSAFAILLFLGLLFNYIEFGTLLPHYFSGILPFPRYNIMIYIIPFLFSVLFFGMYGNAKIGKVEIILFILSIVGPTFSYRPILSPFVNGLFINSFYPVLILLVGGALLGVFHKKGFTAYLIAFGIFLGIVALGIYTSIKFYNLAVIYPDSTRALIIMKDLFLFSLPFYFLLLLHHNIVKKNPHISLNKIVSVFFSLIALAVYLTQWGIKIMGSGIIERVFAMPLYMLVVFLMSIILFEPINKKNSV